jgi:protein translocase SecG subunit
MLSIIAYLLTVVLVVDALFLILLVLIQLPKKEAGAGLAFGAGTTDALFGAGSGTALTKITKYAVAVFFILAVLLSVIQNREIHSRKSGFVNALQASKDAAKPAPPPAASTLNLPTNLLQTSTTALSNAPAAPATKPAAPAQTPK